MNHFCNDSASSSFNIARTCRFSTPLAFPFSSRISAQISSILWTRLWRSIAWIVFCLTKSALLEYLPSRICLSIVLTDSTGNRIWTGTVFPFMLIQIPHLITGLYLYIYDSASLQSLIKQLVTSSNIYIVLHAISDMPQLIT